jgi:hypothetical protein
MSEMTGKAATGGQIGPSDAASSGTPTGSDLTADQGLNESADDPTDPEAAREGDGAPGEAPFAELLGSDDSTGGSDPMPDVSGTSGQ